ncbi:MAG: lactonase, 7-bladed beta-propeller [Betaproteobacteria bacterium]|nr:lactonase, 7-bladed beta-propeller [Betaproteobacteria bacterium]
MRQQFARRALALALLAAGFASPSYADLAVSANDGKITLANGVAKVNPDGKDSVTVIDLAPTRAGKPPRVIAEFAAPASIVGPPQSVAIMPDESLALVTSNQKINPADPTKTMPNNVMSVIDLKANPPAVIATVETGLGPAGVSIGPKGNIALVANREEGTVSVYAIENKALIALGKIELGNPKSGPSGIAISPDGKMALVTRDGDHRISVLAIEQAKVEYIKRDLFAGQRPYGIHFASTGDFAVMANLGMAQGDADTISLIDTKVLPPRIVETVTAGQTPEGIALSPDNKYVAVTVTNGSNKAINSPFYNTLGVVKLYKVVGQKLVYVSQVNSGVWTQGVVFSADGKTLVVQNKEENELQVIKRVGDKLVDTKQRIKLSAGPVGIRTKE